MSIFKFNISLKLLAIVLLMCVGTYLLTCVYYWGRGSESLTSLLNNDNSKTNCYDEWSKGLIKTDANVEDLQEIYEIIKKSTGCFDKPLTGRVQQRGKYWVLYNYVTAQRRFGCAESITYTTHGDFTFLSNIEPLVEKWHGPVSLALYAPGEDFGRTLDSIRYLKYCGRELVREYVTFHIYFEDEHMPSKIPKADDVPYDCSQLPPYLKLSPNQSFKAEARLPYPVNVARNIARETAQTHFVLPSDIELYPSPNIIRDFLIMVANDTRLSRTFGNPKVFPLHLFEVKAEEQVPSTKTKLKEMLSKGTAVPFHKFVCSYCHKIPKTQEWMDAEETEGLHVFTVGKRYGAYASWEPIFIGTNSEPFYDERLTWDGLRDKMTQAYALCVLDYSFLVLDNAFLVHRPGIKYHNPNENNDTRRIEFNRQTNILIGEKIYPELKVVYGEKHGCVV